MTGSEVGAKAGQGQREGSGWKKSRAVSPGWGRGGLLCLSICWGTWAAAAQDRERQREMCPERRMTRSSGACNAREELKWCPKDHEMRWETYIGWGSGCVCTLMSVCVLCCVCVYLGVCTLVVYTGVCVYTLVSVYIGVCIHCCVCVCVYIGDVCESQRERESKLQFRRSNYAHREFRAGGAVLIQEASEQPG